MRCCLHSDLLYHFEYFKQQNLTFCAILPQPLHNIVLETRLTRHENQIKKLMYNILLLRMLKRLSMATDYFSVHIISNEQVFIKFNNFLITNAMLGFLQGKTIERLVLFWTLPCAHITSSKPQHLDACLSKH